MITSIVIVFLIGYFLIATESITRINKAAYALMICAACWVLYAL